MPKKRRFDLLDFSAFGMRSRWLLLVSGSLAGSLALWLLSVSANVLLGSMLTAIFLSATGAGVRLQQQVFLLAQGMLGVIIARSITPESMEGILAALPIMPAMVLVVLVICSFMGWFLARREVFPGSTAIWGMAPGAAIMMILMADEYGADSRVVAFMQYLRMTTVSLLATLVASIWGEPVLRAGQAATSVAAATEIETLPAIISVAIAVVGVAISRKVRVPAGALMIPLTLAVAVNLSGYMRVTVPWWLLPPVYVVIGWGIGGRFNRDILLYVVAALPKLLLSMTVLILFCGAAAALFAAVGGMDPMSAYLATSPGGMDVIAIIAFSVDCDTSFVITAHLTRFIVVTIVGPALSGYVARKAGYARNPKSDKN